MRCRAADEPSGQEAKGQGNRRHDRRPDERAMVYKPSFVSSFRHRWDGVAGNHMDACGTLGAPSPHGQRIGDSGHAPGRPNSFARLGRFLEGDISFCSLFALFGITGDCLRDGFFARDVLLGTCTVATRSTGLGWAREGLMELISRVFYCSLMTI